MESIVAADRPTFHRPQVNLPAPDGEHPAAANVESSRSMSSDWHSGHSKSRSESCIRRSISKRLPHFWQRYSYKGIGASCYQDAKTRRPVTIELVTERRDLHQ